MLQNLLLTNLFLVANSLITISFILFAFLYLDLYFKSKKSVYAFYVGLGGFLIAVSFACALLFEIYKVGELKEYIILSLQFLGLLLVAFGYAQEVVPTAPISSKKTVQVKSTLFPLFASFLFFTNFLISAFITSKQMYKVHYGRSNEFKPLLYFWFMMTFIFFLNMIAFFSNDRFVLLEVAFSKYSVIWILLQIVLLVAFALMYKWIRLFLSFRSFSKVLIDIWSFSIILCILITSLFLTINMSSYEKEITQVLRNNGDMVEYSILQIEKSNGDVLSSIVSSKEIVNAIDEKDTVSLESQLRFLAAEKSNLDQILIVGIDGRIIYSSDTPDSAQELVEENVLLNSVLSKKEPANDYFLQRQGTIMQQLVHQTLLPVFSENSFLGVVIGSKNLGYAFLNNLNAYTNQEILLLDDSDVVLASVLNEESNVLGFDDNVRFERVKHLDEHGSVFMEINNRPYLGSVIEIADSSGGNLGKLIVLNSYNIVAATAQNSMYLTSFYALIVSLLAFIPSYFLAKRIEKESV